MASLTHSNFKKPHFFKWGLFFLLFFSSTCFGNLFSLASAFTDNPNQCYRPGFHFGGQFGTAWINTSRFESKGNFSWGLYGGYNMRALQTLFVGVQAGYNDNGHAFINHNKLESKDWELLGTFSTLFSGRLLFQFKGGVACIKETLNDSSKKEYHPTITVGGGIGLCQFLHLFVNYRGVFAHKHDLIDEDLKIKYISSVNSILSGFAITF